MKKIGRPRATSCRRNLHLLTADNCYVTKTGRYCIACRKETHNKRPTDRAGRILQSRSNGFPERL